MTTVEETIPDALQPEVEAALAWFNQSEGVTFEVTGILDPQAALEASGSRDLHLILCGGDRCERRSFRVTESGSGRVGIISSLFRTTGKYEYDNQVSIGAYSPRSGDRSRS